jgi:hypothetical protein
LSVRAFLGAFGSQKKHKPSKIAQKTILDHFKVIYGTFFNFSIFDFFFLILVDFSGALTPINQNAIKQEKCDNMERSQTERGQSERAQTLFSIFRIR